MVNNPDNIYFEETQQFRQLWIWFLVIPICSFGIALFIYTMYMQLVQGNPVGSKPIPNNMLIWFGPLMLIILISIPVLLYYSKLTVQVNSKAIYIYFTPFLKREILLDDIASCHARNYKPILEYGGWGIHWGPSGKAYNVSGSWGVQLKLNSGKRLLIGSQRAQEFEAAVNNASHN